MRPACLCLILLALAGCGGTETVTLTTTERTTVTVATTATVQAEAAIFVPQPAGPPTFKPDSIDLYVSAPGFIIDKWVSYGGATATAQAWTETNDCEPDCASGTRDRIETAIELSRPVACKGVPAYSSLRVVDSSESAMVGQVTDLHAMGCQDDG